MGFRQVMTDLVARAVVRYASQPRRRGNLSRYLGELLRAYMDDAAYAKFFLQWQAQGIHVTPKHFYQPIPDTEALADSLWEREHPLPGITMNTDRQLTLLTRDFPHFADEYNAFPSAPTDVPYEFHFNNGFFDGTDALALYCMLRHYRPQRIIEVGSGFSTYVMASALRANGEGRLTSIDPYPNDTIRAGVPGLDEVVIRKVEDVEPEFFESLIANDILFIDSSHCVRVGGDVNHLYLDVLPRLTPGVIVHVHDVFLPAEYPRQWIKDRGIFWTEQYLLQAFLIYNSAFEVLLANQYLWRRNPEAMKTTFPASQPWWGGGSFWMQRKSV